LDFDPSKWSARNPLGIIALFISLIYGMSALLLGVSVQRLSLANQTVLVWFVVLFPVAVLAVFAWLVSKHHRKLYGPGDFRSDESFLTAGSSPPETLGLRLSQEAASAQAQGEPEPAENPPALPNMAPAEAPPPARPQTTDELARKIFLAESLVFQDLQNELNGAVRRQVTFRSDDRVLAVDGIIESPDTIYIVEVKFLRSITRAADQTRKSIDLLNRFYESLLASSSKSIKLVVALVFDIPGLDLSVAQSITSNVVRENNIPTVTKVYLFDDLIRKYALSGVFARDTSTTA
jgi:hypothetical protein